MNAPKSTVLAAATVVAAGFSLLPLTARAQSPTTTPSVSSSPAPAATEGGQREDFRARMAERLKGQLKVSDDEWSVIQPLLEKVTEKMRAASGFGGFGGPGGPGGGRQRREGANNGGENQQADNNGGNRPQRREGGPRGGGSPETQALRETLANDNSTVADVKVKLQAVRDQRKQATTELVQAREDLRKVLNMRQEAALVMDGILD